MMNLVETPENYDLHCHSNASDGMLPPAELVARAHELGVTVLALTDHDDVAGLAPARQAAEALGLKFINGVEISVTWGVHTLHVVGLNIDPEHPELVAGLAVIRAGRSERAIKMAEGLRQVGIVDSLAGAYQYAGNPNLIGRMHFARHLVAAGIVKDTKTVFKKYLVKGKPAMCRINGRIWQMLWVGYAPAAGKLYLHILGVIKWVVVKCTSCWSTSSQSVARG